MTEQFEIQCLDYIAGKGPAPHLAQLIRIRKQLSGIQPDCVKRAYRAYRATMYARIISRFSD